MATATDIVGDYRLPENGFTAPEGKEFKAWGVGSKEYDEGDTITVTADTLVRALWKKLAEASYRITGATKYTKGSGKDLVLTSNADFSKFKCVRVDGKMLAARHYAAEEGSTVVTLFADYLETLSAGKHTFEIVSIDGSATAAFSIAKPSKPATKTDIDDDEEESDEPEEVLYVGKMSGAGAVSTKHGPVIDGKFTDGVLYEDWAKDRTTAQGAETAAAAGTAAAPAAAETQSPQAPAEGAQETLPANPSTGAAQAPPPTLPPAAGMAALLKLAIALFDRRTR